MDVCMWRLVRFVVLGISKADGKAREVFKKMCWVWLRLRCKFHVSLAGTKVRTTVARASGRTLVESVSAVLENRQAGLFMSGLLECKAIDSLRRAAVLLDKRFFEKPTIDTLSCIRDALHLVIPFLPMSQLFSQQWSVEKSIACRTTCSRQSGTAP
jgi:hypothetical protein